MNIPAVLTHLAAAGITPDVVAAELAVAPSLVAVWTAGTRIPSLARRASLRALVDDLLHAAADRDALLDVAQERSLLAAREALLTDEDRARVAALAARWPACTDDAALAA